MAATREASPGGVVAQVTLAQAPLTHSTLAQAMAADMVEGTFNRAMEVEQLRAQGWVVLVSVPFSAVPWMAGILADTTRSEVASLAAAVVAILLATVAVAEAASAVAMAVAVATSAVTAEALGMEMESNYTNAQCLDNSSLCWRMLLSEVMHA